MRRFYKGARANDIPVDAIYKTIHRLVIWRVSEKTAHNGAGVDEDAAKTGGGKPEAATEISLSEIVWVPVTMHFSVRSSWNIRGFRKYRVGIFNESPPLKPL